MKLIFTLSFSLFVLFGYGQNPWQKVSEIAIITKKTGDRLTIPEKYDTYTLDMAQLQQHLAKAPLTTFSDKTQKKAHLSLPLANGTIETFQFIENPAMSPVLSSKFPNIKSYKGQSLDNPRNQAWIDYSPSGFRAAINSPLGTMYIDPYFDKADENYIVYFVRDDVVDTENLGKSCGTVAYEEQIKEEHDLLNPNPQTTSNKNLGMPVIKTTYRFALACTGQWGDQQGGDVASILAKMNSATNRLNSFFEPELAMKLELIDDNDKLIFFQSNNPYIITPNPTDGSHPGRQVLNQNNDILIRFVGEDNFDLGHVITIRCTDGIAGVARAGVCVGLKGAGVSCIGNSNINNFITSTTAHELGHQFTAGHTWNSCTGSEDQFSASDNCEPGSGTTIMSYHNLCDDGNLSGPSGDYYHVCSLEPIYSYVENGLASQCGTHIAQANTIPDVWIEQEGGFTIPISTPFELTGYANDMDGDELLYNWDQINNAPISYPLGSPAQNAAAFRSYQPGSNTTRVFPKISDVLAGRDNIEEKLPTYSRDLDFAFIARDNNLDAGGVNWVSIGFEASELAGPFRVTTPSQFTTTNGGEYLDVEWSVANTDQAPVNARFVDIYLSTDGGLSFPHLLLERTANDGAESVRLPNVIADNCKVKVKGNGNIFFNINRNIIKIDEATAPGYFLSASENYFKFCLPGMLETEISGESFLGFSDDITLDIVSGLPAIATYSFTDNVISADGMTTLSIDMSEVQFSDAYEVVIQGIAGTDTVLHTITIDATGTNLTDISLTNPPNNTRGVGAIPDFEWVGSPNATSYRLEVATNPAFEDADMIISKNTGTATTGSELVNLENSTIYYWRIVSVNDCIGEVGSAISTFSSNALSCNIFAAEDTPLNISTSGTPTIRSSIPITFSGTLSDVNVELVKGNHNSIASLRTKLISPIGTEVILFQGACLNNTIINAGFDSDSAFPNGCPDRNGDKIKPFDDLSILNGEPIEGSWTLQIEDTQAGSGGTLEDFQIELCSTGTLFSPFMVNNEVLEVLTGSGNKLEQIDLLCEDENNTASELRYTIVETPINGNLFSDNNQLRAGSRFTQTDINNGAIKYKHTGTADGQDSFVFVVEDGEGGWIEPTTFLINMSAGGNTGVEDIKDASAYFKIFPNPANDIINISQIDNGNADWSAELTSMDGKRIATKIFNTATELNVSQYQSGTYILKISNAEMQVSQKVTVVRD